VEAEMTSTLSGARVSVTAAAVNSAVPPRFGPPPLPVGKPSMLGFYRGWCWFFVVIWMAMAAYGVFEICHVVDPQLGIIEGLLVKDDPAQHAALIEEKRADAIGVVVLSLIGTALYGVAACVPRKRWGWVVGLIAIIGTFLPFLITTAGMIPLLIAWVKPEVKRYFNAH
jgi:hypothetical protein